MLWELRGGHAVSHINQNGDGSDPGIWGHGDSLDLWVMPREDNGELLLDREGRPQWYWQVLSMGSGSFSVIDEGTVGSAAAAIAAGEVALRNAMAEKLEYRLLGRLAARGLVRG